jgi:hypothetical protein
MGRGGGREVFSSRRGSVVGGGRGSVADNSHSESPTAVLHQAQGYLQGTLLAQ